MACFDLAVNIASACLLSGSNHAHSHGHGHGEGETHDEEHRFMTPGGILVLEVYEDGVPPRFRLRAEAGPALAAHASSLETVRPDGTRQQFDFVDRGGYLQSTDELPEPHAFVARVRVDADEHSVVLEEHEHAHGYAHRDNNMRAAVIHVVSDAAVSVLVIVGLLLARALGWLWIDPLAGVIGACVIASRSYGLIRDTGAILLDMNPDRRMANSLQQTIKADGDRIADLHLWRLGPGHLGAIACVETQQVRGPEYYRAKLARFRTLSHLTIEVQSA